MKGSMCSISGNIYEKEIYTLLKQCNINGVPFNTQKEEELGGSSRRNDIECNLIIEKDIGIEVKKSKTPDWMQCSIKFDESTKMWMTSKNSKNPYQCSVIFTELINRLKLYDGDVPPFMTGLITHKEWIEFKKKTNKWDDKYINIPDDTISILYKAKGCD
jgi:hypothetical protein